MSDVCTGMELLGDDALARWSQLAAQIRSEFGKDSTNSAVYASQS